MYRDFCTLFCAVLDMFFYLHNNHHIQSEDASMSNYLCFYSNPYHNKQISFHYGWSVYVTCRLQRPKSHQRIVLRNHSCPIYLIFFWFEWSVKQGSVTADWRLQLALLCLPGSLELKNFMIIRKQLKCSRQNSTVVTEDLPISQKQVCFGFSSGWRMFMKFVFQWNEM